METLKRADKGGFEQEPKGVRMFGRLASQRRLLLHYVEPDQQLLNDIATVTDTQIIEARAAGQHGRPPGPPCCYVISPAVVAPVPRLHRHGLVWSTPSCSRTELRPSASESRDSLADATGKLRIRATAPQFSQS